MRTVQTAGSYRASMPHQRKGCMIHEWISAAQGVDRASSPFLGDAPMGNFGSSFGGSSLGGGNRRDPFARRKIICEKFDEVIKMNHTWKRTMSMLLAMGMLTLSIPAQGIACLLYTSRCV